MTVEQLQAELAKGMQQLASLLLQKESLDKQISDLKTKLTQIEIVQQWEAEKAKQQHQAE